MPYFFNQIEHLEGNMGYKKVEPNMTFAELSLMSSMEHNRTLKLLEKINNIIEWSKVESLLMAHYTVGTSNEGADAYPPMMLLRAFLLQKWFKVKSDPELENQINDRISFKMFRLLSLDKPSRIILRELCITTQTDLG